MDELKDVAEIKDEPISEASTSATVESTPDVSADGENGSGSSGGTELIVKKKQFPDAEAVLQASEENGGEEDDGEEDDEAGSTDAKDGNESDALASLIYDDDEVTELKNDEIDTGRRTVNLFSLGDMIPRPATKEASESDALTDEIDTASDATDENAASAEAETPTEETDDATGEADDDEDELDAEANEDDGSEGESEEPEQIEFDLGEIAGVHTEPDDVELIDDDVNQEQDVYDPERPRWIDTVFDFFELLIMTLVAVMVLTSFVFKHSVVDGTSMDKTLAHNDHLILYGLFYTPERYDIIVFADYTTAEKKPLVKRVIALPGEHIVITEDGVVTVNGEVLDEDYVYTSDLPNYKYAPLDLIVPEGEVFVMGDHRTVSNDSRNEMIGTVDIDSILGKVVLRIYPFEKFGTVD